MSDEHSSLFLTQLSSALFSLQDSFEMAKAFGRLTLRHARLDSAVLIWPDDNRSSTQPRRMETLGKKPKPGARKIHSVRFRDEGKVFFRIDFFSLKTSTLPSSLKKDLALAHKMVTASIEANEKRLQVEDQERFKWMRHLSAGLSHELNTPLTTLAFHIKKLTAESTSSQALGFIQKALSQIGRTLSQFRVFSGDGQFTELESVTINQVVSRAKKHIQQLFPSQASWIQFQTVDSSRKVEVQSGGIEQIISLLVANSIEAIAAAKAKNPNITVKISCRNHKMQLKVTDNGIGVRAVDRPFIFAPFFSTKDVNQGTGLGLSMARAIAFLNNGTLRFNPLSENTQFILEFPLVKAEPLSRRKVA
jgi:signal transduction histidine kinase